MSEVMDLVAESRRKARIEQCRNFGKNHRLKQSLQQQLDCLCDDLARLFSEAGLHKGTLPAGLRGELMVVFERVKSIERQDERKVLKKAG